MPKLKDRFKKGLSVGSALGVVLSGVFLSPLVAATSAQANTVGSGACTQAVSNSSGVEVAQDGTYCVIQFKDTGSNTWTVPAGVEEVEFLIIGGGGAGGNKGGGGAGEFRPGTWTVDAETVNVFVGDGGDGVSSGLGGNNGENSSFGSLVALGGGGGGGSDNNYNGADGGSGGGGSYQDASGGSSIASAEGYGSAGGAANVVAGGGGGAGGAGETPNSNSKAGDGGPGKSSSISGQEKFYAAGGGGGIWDGSPGVGGDGGGGNGADRSGSPENGALNTGSGGGGTGYSQSSGAKGGSGVVVLRYDATPAEVTNLQVSSRDVDPDLDPDSVTLQWGSVTATPAVTSYTIEYSTDPTFATAETPITGITTTSHSFSLPDGDTYYFRVKAINDIGQGPFSEVIASRAESKEDFSIDVTGDGFAKADNTEVIPNDDVASFSVEAWITPTTIDSYHVIAEQRNDPDTNTGYFWLGLHNDGSGSIEVWKNSSLVFSYQPSSLVGKWTHVAVTVSASETIKLYVDGSEVAERSLTGDDVTAVTGNLFSIGSGRASNNSYPFKGQIDQVKIWDGVLIQTEIEDSMHAWQGDTNIGSSLISHYDFNDNTQSSVVRDMAGSNDLQVSGSPTSVALVEPDTETKPDSVLYEFTRSYLTSEGGWTPPTGVAEVDALVVGGGGGGAGNSNIDFDASGGAGGGGGVYPADNLPISGVVEVTVGQGGVGGKSVEGVREGASGNPGQTSSLEGLTAGGGGGGGCEAYPGQNGVACGFPATIHGVDGNAAGSSGSPSNFYSAYSFGEPGTATSATINGKSFPAITAHRGGYYNDGGSSTAGSSGSAGGAGGAGTYNSPGAGVTSSITGLDVIYGGGGFGWHGDNGWSSYAPASNTGFGGKGAYSTSASRGFDGASGVIVLAYEVAVVNVSISGDDSALTTETVEFTADTSDSQGNLTYTWERKRSGESDWTTVATSGTSYTTPALTLADDQSQYRVTVVSAINGTSDEETSNVIMLSVSDIVDHYLVFDVDATDLASFDPTTPAVVNDRSGTVTPDSSVVGTTQIDNGLFEFDGAGDYLDIGDFPDSVDFSEGLTVDFVANFGSAQNWERIIDFGDAAEMENIVVSRQLNSTNLHYLSIDSSGNRVFHDFSNAVLNDASARYTLFVQDKSISLYRDGVLLETNSITSGTYLPIAAERVSNFVGKSNWSLDQDFEGTIEYVRVFNYSFDASALDIIDPDFKTVSFNSQGGATVSDKKTSGSMLLPPAPTRAGYNFAGWYLSDTKVGDPGNVYAPSSDLTLDAEWVIDPDRLLIDFDATDTNSFDRADQSISQRNGDYSGSVNGDLTDGELDRANFDIGDNVSLITIPASINWGDGFTLDFTADFGSANAWERIIDLGTGGFSNQLVFGRLDTTNDMMLEIWGASLSHKIKFEDVLTDSGEHRYTLLYDGTNATLVIDGDAINAITGVDGGGNGGATLPANVERDTNYLGFASRSGTSSGKFDGTLRELKLYSAAYTTDDLSALETTFTTVNFRSENGDFSLETSGSMRLPDPGVNSGKVFDGWHSDSELSNKIGDIGAVHTPGDTELFAKWISEFTLELYSEAAIVDTQTVTIGSSAADPQINRTGYTLLGWDTDPSADNVVYQDDLGNFSMPPNDEDLYAVWAADDFTATFINNSSTFTTQTFDVETALTDTGNPSSVGDRFLGWSTVSDDPASIVSFPYQPAAGNLDLYAVYSVDYAASFDGDDGDQFTSGAGVIPSSGSFTWEAWIYPTGFNSNWASVLENGDTGSNFGRAWLQITGPDNQANPTTAEIGVGFYGTNTNGTALFTNAGVIQMNTWQHVAASYEISGGSVTISAYVNGTMVGTPATAPMSGSLSSQELRVGEADWADQEFEGYIDQVKIWNGDVLTETQVAESMESVNSITGINPSSYYNFDELGSTVTTGNTVEDQIGSFDLAANGTMSRQLNDYSVTYDANGGTGAPVDANLYSPFTPATVLAAGSIEQTNFSFTGWNTKADGTGDPYSATDILSMLYGDVTLYAQWNQDTFAVTINKGNFGGGSDISLTKSAGVDLTLPGDTQANNTFTRDGYLVAGWSTDPQGDTKAYDFDQAYTLDEPDTLYPFWVKDTFDLNFVVDGVTTTQQVEFEAVPVFAGSAPTGYTISGWSDGTTTYAANLNDFNMPASTVTLTATLVADVNTITFEANNGSGETTTQQITTDVQTALSANTFTFDGYAFAGWVDKNDSNNTYDNQELVTFNSDVTLQAVWTAETYDIVFVYNGADTNASLTSTTYTTDQTTDLTLPNPGKAGHSFAGWYSDSELTTFEGNANDVFTTVANVTLYAKWTAIARTVIYSANAVINGQNVTAVGTVPVDSESYVIGESVPVAANSGSTGDPLSVNHYSFVGWTDQADGSGELLQPGESFIMGDGNVTLFAKWEPVTYTINYLANGAAGTPSRTSDSRTVENAVISPLPTVGDMVKVGYELAGWATDPDATAAEVVSFISVDKNANYYAIWELKTINYSFSAGVANGTNLDSGTLTGFPNNGSADYGTTITIPTGLQPTLDLDSNSIVDNYLTGWSYDGKVYQPGESFILGEQDPVFVAVWAPLRQVRYSTNGGTQTDPAGEFDELCVMEDNTCSVDLEITLHDEPTRAGYNFLHWEDQKGGTHDAGDVFIVQDDNYLLFAKWEAIQYTFAFANSFKVGGQPNITATIGQTIQFPAAIDRTGYSFGGWENNGTVYGEKTDFIVGTEGLLFTAIWIPNVYTITFDWQGGTGTASPTATYTVGTGPMNLPETGNAKDGFVFGGWSESQTGAAVSADYEPTESRVLYAVWDSGFYQTTFDPFGGTVTNTVVQVPESTGISLPLPERPSFTFTGWVDTNDNLVGINGDTYTPTINETLTATWVQDSRAGVNPANLSDLLNTTLNGQGIDTTISQGDISVRIVVPQEAFSQEVAIDMDLFTNNDLQDSILGSENNYVLSVLLSWISGSGSSATVPNTNPDHPIVLTISDPDIKVGARIYKVIGTRVEDLGVASQDGEITVEIFEDPSIVLAATKPDQVVISSVSAGDEQATLSWSEPGNGGSEITNYTVTSNLGDSCSVAVTTCTITGLTNGTSYTFTVTATNSVGTSDPSAVSAAVEPSFVTYPVVFDSNGGSNVANTTYPRLGSINKPVDPVLLGYTFGGWSTVLDDEQTVVDFTGGSYNPSVDQAQTFFALWSADDNTVTFKANFENEADQTQVITTDVETALTINSFIRSGYRFLGWAESESGDVVYEDEELVIIKEPMTLWAVWSRNPSPAEESFEAEESVSKPDYSESGGARTGETIEFEISGGQRVTSATVGDVAVEFRETAAGFEITVPESLSPGTYDLVVNFGGEEVTYQDYVVILASVIPDTRFWTKRISDTEAKVYIKYVRLGEQYSIGHQTGGVGEYDPVTMITAENFADDRLRFALGTYYIVRTINLEPGINRINVYVNGEQQELRGRMDPVRYTK